MLVSPGAFQLRMICAAGCLSLILFLQQSRVYNHRPIKKAVQYWMLQQNEDSFLSTEGTKAFCHGASLGLCRKYKS